MTIRWVFVLTFVTLLGCSHGNQATPVPSASVTTETGTKGGIGRDVIEGVLEGVIADGFVNGTSETVFSLRTDQNERIALDLSPAAIESLSPGSRVRVEGALQRDRSLMRVNTEIGGQASVRAIEVPGGARTQSATVTTGALKVAVILVYFGDRPPDSPPALSRADVASFIFNPNQLSVNSFYQENSYGKLSVPGDAEHNVFGWYRIADMQPPCMANTEPTVGRAITAAGTDIDFASGFTHVMVIAPFTSAAAPWCRYGGVASLGSNAPFQTWQGTVRLGVTLNSEEMFGFYGTPFVPAHELGHNLGLGHANFANCGNVSFPYGTNTCTHIEYGDRYDTMGAGAEADPALGLPHFNAIYKQQLGWFNPGNVQEVTQSGTYTIEPLETPSNNTKVLKIGQYYLEYRQPFGIDSNLNTHGDDVFTGALIHNSVWGTYLFDPTPPSDPFNAALTPGLEIIDPAGSYFRVISRRPQQLTVEVIPAADFVKIVSPASGAQIPDVPPQAPVLVHLAHPELIAKIDFAVGTALPFATVTSPGSDVSVAMPVAGLYHNGQALNLTVTGTHGEKFQGYVPFFLVWVSSPVITTLMSPMDGLVLNSPRIYLEAGAPDPRLLNPFVGFRVDFVADRNGQQSGGYWDFWGELYSRPAGEDCQENDFFWEFMASWDGVGNWRPVYTYSGTSVCAFDGVYRFMAEVSDCTSGSCAFDSAPATVIVDTTPPTIALTSPTVGQVLSGLTAIGVSAQDSLSGISQVTLLVDNADIATSTEPPYGFSWNSASVSNGSHVLKIRASDVAGNTAESAPQTILVNNVIPQPPICKQPDRCSGGCGGEISGRPAGVVRLCPGIDCNGNGVIDWPNEYVCTCIQTWPRMGTCRNPGGPILVEEPLE